MSKACTKQASAMLLQSPAWPSKVTLCVALFSLVPHCNATATLIDIAQHHHHGIERWVAAVQVANCVRKAPCALLADVEQGLLPLVEYLQGLGLSMPNIATVVTKCASWSLQWPGNWATCTQVSQILPKVMLQTACTHSLISIELLLATA